MKFDHHTIAQAILAADAAFKAEEKTPEVLIPGATEFERTCIFLAAYTPVENYSLYFEFSKN